MLNIPRLLCSLLCFTSLTIFAEPSTLTINKKIKPQSTNKWIKAVHQEIPVIADNIASIRYAILEGMLTTKGYKWTFEGEGEGYILTRFDYRGDTNIMRIEYSDNLIQLKYHDAYGDFVCKNLVEDICYKNSRGYYNYIKNLRRSIAFQVGKL